jgi:hypothetical protein
MPFCVDSFLWIVENQGIILSTLASLFILWKMGALCAKHVKEDESLELHRFSPKKSLITELKRGCTEAQFAALSMNLQLFDSVTETNYPYIIWGNVHPSSLVPDISTEKGRTFDSRMAGFLLNLISFKTTETVLRGPGKNRLPPEMRYVKMFSSFCHLFCMSSDFPAIESKHRPPKTFFMTIRNSVTIDEYYDDIDARQFDVNLGSAYIHIGGAKRYEALTGLDEFLSSLIRGDTLVLGAYGTASSAAALLAGLRVRDGIKVILYTFAHGRLGDHRLMEFTKKSDGRIGVWWSVLNECDIITHVPYPLHDTSKGTVDYETIFMPSAIIAPKECKEEPQMAECNGEKNARRSMNEAKLLRLASERSKRLAEVRYADDPDKIVNGVVVYASAYRRYIFNLETRSYRNNHSIVAYMKAMGCTFDISEAYNAKKHIILSRV